MLLWLNGTSSCFPSSFFLEYMTYTWRAYTSEWAFLCFCFLLFCLAEDNLLSRRKINTFLVCIISFSWGDIRLFFFADELMRFRASPKRDFAVLRFLLFSFCLFLLNSVFFFHIFSLHPCTFRICESSLHILYILFQIVNLLSCLSVPILCPLWFFLSLRLFLATALGGKCCLPISLIILSSTSGYRPELEHYFLLLLLKNGDK